MKKNAPNLKNILLNYFNETYGHDNFCNIYSDNKQNEILFVLHLNLQ